MFGAGIHGRIELNKTGVLKTLLLITLMLVLTPIADARERGKPKIEAVPNEYVVQLKRPIGEMQLSSVSAMVGAKVIETIQDDVVLIKKVGNGRQMDVMRSLSKNSAIVRVEPNYIYRFNRIPNDPDMGRLWGLKNRGDLDAGGMRGLKNVDVGVEKAWDITTGSKDILVAVIDTGVDYTHPDLAANMWVNELEKNGIEGFDDDGNGYIDDIYGYDFANDDGDPMDDNAHGTHCAGTIGASGNDGKGLVGVSWNVSIMAIKFLSGSGGGTLANAIKSINYATMMGVDVMNNSWGGGGYSEILKESIKRANRAGIVFVAAAGNSTNDNDTSPEYPASYEVPNVISVAAIDNRGDLAYFSNYGAKSVHVAAPGHNILSAVPGGTDTYSGTSMAAPHVTGVVSLLLAHTPNMSFEEVKTRLVRTSKPLALLTGRVASGGVVDAFYALVNVKAPPDENDPSVFTLSKEELVETAHPYPENLTQTWKIRVPGAKRVAVFFKRFDTEEGYDQVEFTNSAGEKIGRWSGARDGRFSPIADGDTLNLKFTSDDVKSGHGFTIDRIVYE